MYAASTAAFHLTNVLLDTIVGNKSFSSLKIESDADSITNAILALKSEVRRWVLSFFAKVNVEGPVVTMITK